MFFILSKIVGYLVQPLVLVLLLAAASLALGAFGLRRTAFAGGALAIAALVAMAISPLGLLMMAVLENRFPRPAELPVRVDGIVVLGGSFDTRVGRTRGVAELNEAGDRITEAVRLAKLYPEARVLFSGGVAAILDEDIAEDGLAESLFQTLGIEPERLLLEGRARNTVENAVFSKELADPQPGETWLLVTSAYHMPRSVGCFRAAGFEVVPYPVDYRTPAGPAVWRPSVFVVRNLDKVHAAFREYVGLAAYWWTGRIPELFPGP